MFSPTMNVGWLLLLACAQYQSPDEFAEQIKTNQYIRNLVEHVQKNGDEIKLYMYAHCLAAEEGGILPRKRTQVKKMIKKDKGE